MYWKFESSRPSLICTILDKENVSLIEVLEQEDVIQECKNSNKKLVDYLAKAETIAQLLDLILQEPEGGVDEKVRFKLPNIASELITCDIPAINEMLTSDISLMDRMYSFLDTEHALNPLLSSFFSKAFGVLITRRSDQNWYSYQLTCVRALSYIKSRPGFTRLLLRHIHTSAVMDLLLRLITCVDGTEMKQGVLEWLNDEKLIENIIQLFSASNPLFQTGGSQEQASSPSLHGDQEQAGSPLLQVDQEQTGSPLLRVDQEQAGSPLLQVDQEQAGSPLLQVDQEQTGSPVIQGEGEKGASPQVEEGGGEGEEGAEDEDEPMSVESAPQIASGVQILGKCG
jgi:hypothetical protein